MFLPHPKWICLINCMESINSTCVFLVFHVKFQGHTHTTSASQSDGFYNIILVIFQCFYFLLLLSCVEYILASRSMWFVNVNEEIRLFFQETERMGKIHTKSFVFIRRLMDFDGNLCKWFCGFCIGWAGFFIGTGFCGPCVGVARRITSNSTSRAMICIFE